MPEQKHIEIFYNEDIPPVICYSISEVDTILDKLEKELASNIPLAVAIRISEFEIDFGLGSESTFLCIQVEPFDGEYYLALGNEKNGDPKMFFGAGQDSYWYPKNLIPTEKVRKAVRYFIHNQKRSPDLNWENWEGRAV